MASFPTATIPAINAIDNVTTIIASHVNNLYDEVANGVETTIGLNPQVISDAVTPIASPTTIGTYLDMVATQLKAITGQAAWYTAPAKTLNQIIAQSVLLPGGTTTGDIFSYTGGLFSRVGIGSAGQMLTVVAGMPAWTTPATPGIPPPSTPALGDLLYYTGAAWGRLAVGAVNNILTVSGGVPAWAASVPGSLNNGAWTSWQSVGTKVNIQLRSPVTVTTAGVVAEYATIATAITAATSGMWVVIPPGTYTENLNIKDGVNVCELVLGTVTIIGTISNATSTCNAFVSVDTIAPASAVISGGTAISLGHTTGRLSIRARVINNTVPAAAGATDVSAIIVAGAGTMDVVSEQVTVDGSGSSFATCNAFIVQQQSGSCSLYMRFGTVSCTAGASGTSYGVYSAGANSPIFYVIGGSWKSIGTWAFYRTLGTVNLWGCVYDPVKISGTIASTPTHSVNVGSAIAGAYGEVRGLNSQNSALAWNVQNSNAGASASARVQVYSDTVFTQLYSLSSGAGAAAVLTVSGGYLIILSSSLMTFGTNGVERIRINTLGALLIGKTVAAGTDLPGYVEINNNLRLQGSNLWALGTALPATTGTMTATMDGTYKTIVPTGACTFNATGGVVGQTCSFVITTSGVSSFVLTFGTNFKSTGTLATGTVSGKVFTVNFVYDGTNWNEASRTTAM